MKKLLFILTTTFIPLLQLSAQSPIKEIGKTKPTSMPRFVSSRTYSLKYFFTCAEVVREDTNQGGYIYGS
jgi:hypothetical protein